MTHPEISPFDGNAECTTQQAQTLYDSLNLLLAEVGIPDAQGNPSLSLEELREDSIPASIIEALGRTDDHHAQYGIRLTIPNHNHPYRPLEWPGGIAIYRTELGHFDPYSSGGERYVYYEPGRDGDNYTVRRSDFNVQKTQPWTPNTQETSCPVATAIDLENAQNSLESGGADEQLEEETRLNRASIIEVNELLGLVWSLHNNARK